MFPQHPSVVRRLGSDRRDARGRANARAFVSKLLVAVSSRLDAGGRREETPGTRKAGDTERFEIEPNRSCSCSFLVLRNVDDGRWTRTRDAGREKTRETRKRTSGMDCGDGAGGRGERDAGGGGQGAGGRRGCARRSGTQMGRPSVGFFRRCDERRGER